MKYKKTVCDSCLQDIEYTDFDLSMDEDCERAYIQCPLCGESIIILSDLDDLDDEFIGYRERGKR